MVVCVNTTLIDQVEFPKSSDMATRLEWAGERAWDIAEGLVGRDVAALIQATVIGWADLGTEDERANYLAMADRINDLRHAA
jgi:hypothetical protein